MTYRLAIFFSFLVACSSPPDLYSEKPTKAPSHDVFSALLATYVDSLGFVNYAAFLNKKEQLEHYLLRLDSFPPHTEWSPSEQKAYWINAYNAATIELVLENYPLSSIRDLHPTPYIPFINTVWHIHNISIGGKKGSLSHIEHEILRPKFKDPRVHFAINCASLSCPRLRNEAYVSEKLDEQLDEQTTLFINDSTKNNIGETEITISPIFNWFANDFSQNESLIDFLNTYSRIQISKQATIHYHEYDWRLNEQGH